MVESTKIKIRIQILFIFPQICLWKDSERCLYDVLLKETLMTWFNLDIGKKHHFGYFNSYVVT